MITPAEAKVARKRLGRSQGMLFIGHDAIGDFERRQRHSALLNLITLQRVFEAAGVEFTSSGPPGVRLSARPEDRERSGEDFI
jgi:hypothetical protein